MAEQQRRAEHQRTERRTVEHGIATTLQTAKKGQPGRCLQEQGKGPCQAPLLAKTKPENTSALHSPGRRRPARIQAEGNGQGGENHPQRQTGFHQQQGATRHLGTQQPRQQQVKQAQPQSAEGRGELDMLDQPVLQAKANQRRAEEDGAVDIITLTRRPAQQLAATAIHRQARGFQQLAPGEQQADTDVHKKEQNQERLGAGQQLRLIGAQAPGKPDAEGADEADQVEQAPGLEPGNGEDAGIQQGKVAEQCHMVAAAGGGQDRRGKTAQRRGGGQPERILGNRQNSRTEGDHHQQAEGFTGAQQGMQAHRGKHRQVQHGDAGALQHQAIVGVAQTQPPAQAKQRHGTGRDPGITHLHRHHHAFGGIAQEKGQTEKQQHHTNPQHGIAAKQPGLGGVDGALQRRRLARYWRSLGRQRLRRHDDRLGHPHIGGQRGRRRHGRALKQFVGQLPDQLVIGGRRDCLHRHGTGRWRRLSHRNGGCLPRLQLAQALLHRYAGLLKARGEGQQFLAQLAVLQLQPL